MQTRRRRCRGDDGTALVEGAIVALPFFILILGILEFGFLFKAYLSVSNATSQGARSASTSGDEVDADFQILTSIDRAFAAIPREEIERIVIFKADSPEDTPNPGCLTGGIPGECNSYTESDFELLQADFNCKAAPTPGVANDDDWCPADRNTYVNNTSGDPIDYIGIYIEYEYQYITGMFGSAASFSDQTVLRLEPQGLNEP